VERENASPLVDRVVRNRRQTEGRRQIEEVDSDRGMQEG
jgi:hypothetical protein